MRWEQSNLETVVSTSNSVKEVCEALGITATSSNYKTFYKYATMYEISYDHFDNRLNIDGIAAHNMKRRIPDSEVFVENSTYNQGRLRNRIIKESILPYKCQECGNEGEWNGQPLSLQLDHINGTNNDNRIENLRFLCPNCHTQTKTWGNKKQGAVA